MRAILQMELIYLLFLKKMKKKVFLLKVVFIQAPLMETQMLQLVNYAAQATASGMGFVFGAGFDGDDGSRAGVSLYSNLGGDSAADMWLFYYGFDSKKIN